MSQQIKSNKSEKDPISIYLNLCWQVEQTSTKGYIDLFPCELMVKLMHLLSLYSIRLGLFLTLLISTILIIGNPLKLYASQSGVGFYSSNSPPASAVEKNVNARNQKCTISANQLLYLTVYSGVCNDGEYPGKSAADLLKCGQDSNKVMKLMQVKVDGKDVSSNIIRQSTSQSFIFTIPPINPYELKEPIVGKHNAMAESYYLFFKPMPVGDHIIELEVIRVPLEANQPVEHDVAKWDIKVIP